MTVNEIFKGFLGCSPFTADFYPPDAAVLKQLCEGVFVNPEQSRRLFEGKSDMALPFWAVFHRPASLTFKSCYSKLKL
uniref:Uncharacterized protein n=1 Tax=Desulfovibrio sp. U5L TaxID=596152 RepID=I2PWM4_9BACT